MLRLSLEYGKTYEIPVTFSSEKITRRLLHGIIHVKERISYLTILVCNEDNLQPLGQDEEIELDMIRCYPKEGGNHLLLVGCTFSSRPMVITGPSSQYRVYFDYLFNGSSKIESSKDLFFNELELFFENLDTWIRPHLPENIDFHTPLFECDIDALEVKLRILPVERTENEGSENRRSWRTTHDVKILLVKKKGKFNLKDLRQVSLELEAFLSCITAVGCFCTQSNLYKKRLRPSKRKDRYNVLDSLHLAEPRYELQHSFYSLIPRPLLQEEADIGTLINTFFKGDDAVREMMRKIASIFLYKNKFLYDVQFMYVATLLEAAYKACLDPSANHKTRKNKKSFMDMLDALLDFQFSDCRLVEFGQEEKDYIKKNRNNLAHGDSLAYRDEHQSILEKLLVLLLYTVLKVLGMPAHVLRNRLVASASVYLYSVNKEALGFFDAEKISITHEQFLEIEQSEIDPERTYCTVLEKYDRQSRVNLMYTTFFDRDHNNIRFLSYITDILRCYYRDEEFDHARYVSGTYLVDETNPEKYIKPISLAVVELKKPLEEVKNLLTDSLIPEAASIHARKERIPVLKAYRITKGLTVGDLAKQTGLSASTIAKYENTYHPPDRMTYQKILKCLGTDIAPIFEEQKKRQAKEKQKRSTSKKVRK